ncbi:hypothetical protein KSS87_023790 [Heliosperma pusillum]|nr:hypothetical protein KSS87_023790 [Heliosperma pusillum]
MIHMLLFCGEPFDCDLGTMMHTGLYRAELAATLILSDINNVREEVMSRVSDFTAAKAVLASQMSGAGKSGIMISLKRSAGTELARTPDKRMRSTDTMEEGDVTVVPIQSAGSLNDTCVRSRRCGRGDGLGCTLQCGDVEENVLLVARSLRLNLTLLKNVQTLRKHVVDYCFLDVWNYAHNEQLVYYNRHAALTRANMLTMLPDVGLCDAVIECWSMLMNRLETDEYDFQRMSFFGIGHMVRFLTYNSWDTNCHFIYCTALILADINTIHDEVVGKVNQFLVEKDDIWTRVHAQLKINKIIMKK